MNRYEVKKNSGWNANIRGLWIVVEDGCKGVCAYEQQETANHYRDILESLTPVSDKAISLLDILTV